jgi:shikimate dehydrogenase
MKCGIIGYPLNNPRSILIWKDYFLKKKIKAKMEPYEIHKKKFDTFIKKIKKDKAYYAFAITMPYKICVIKHCDKLDTSAKLAKTVNLIVKNKETSEIVGFNTDVIGAYKSISKNIDEYQDITIIGLGGVGTCIYNYLNNLLPKINFNLITQKNIKIPKKNKIFKKLNSNILKKKSLIINCTPLGSNLKDEFLSKSPIEENLFKKINKNSLIFDVVYEPKKTELSRLASLRKIKYINGMRMINLQGKEALKIAFKNVNV